MNRLKSVLCGLSAAIVFGACNIVQTENSFSKDASRYGGLGSGSSAFLAFKTIVQTRCTACHSEYFSYSEADWVSLGLVVAANPSGSPLYQRLRGSNVGGLENMPPDVTLTTTEIDAVRDWINTL